ncbi:PKD domain-containing protein [Candidatus Poribacteria bacterium]|nr:PKD domain-containing protein [Candidatus Poribacteria bacterium]
MEKTIYTIIMLAVGLLLPYIAIGYTPNPNSPIGRGEHPRLHITQETLPDFRNKIADFKSEYQRFVNWVDAQFSTDELEPEKGGIMAQYHAFIYQIGLIPGITYGRTMTEYRDRAIQIMINKVNAGLPTIAEGNHGYNDDFSNMSRAYDWMWHELAQEQKTRIVEWLVAAGTIQMEDAQYALNQTLYSSDYFQTPKPWYTGLGFYGDGIQDAYAQTLVDSFNTLMLNGKWLDAQNWVARKNGGLSEIGEYGLYSPESHIVEIDGWRSATGENYFAQGTSLAGPDFIRYLPMFWAYRMRPAEPDHFILWGQMDSSTELIEAADLLKMLEVPVNGVDLDMAALNKWFTEDRKISGTTRDWYVMFRDVLFGDKTIIGKSPETLNLPLTQHFEGIGMTFMRTGFNDKRDTAFVIGAPVYRYDGHDWGGNGQFPLGFTIDKYGPLALKRGGYVRGQEHRGNTMRFTDPLLAPDGGLTLKLRSPQSILEYSPSSEWYRGGTLRLETFDETGAYDYAYVDVARNYLSDRVRSYTRQYVYLRPSSVTDSDYIVIFDRAETTRPDILKRWELNMAYNPAINGAETQIKDGKWQYAGADQIVINNDLLDPDPYNGESHPEGYGKLFVKSLLPESVIMEKNGGPDYEFVDDAGIAHGYENEGSDYARLNEAGAFYTGTYFVNVLPAAPALKDNFLHVLQTADGNLVTSMTPTVRVDGDTMVGAHIKDAVQGEKVAMFSRTEANQARANYSISTSKPVSHLIADLAPFGTYDVYQDGKRIDTLPASEAGTISFNSNGGGSFQISSNSLPPTVVASAAPMIGVAPLSVSFTAVASDLDGTIQSYSWNFGDGAPGSAEQNSSHTYQLNGVYAATVTVTDDSGLTAVSSATITVTLPPEVVASANVTSGQAPLTVDFVSIGQNIVSYNWAFGDGDTSKEQNPQHTYQNPGAYTATVTGTDSIGQVTTDSLNITVLGPLATIAISPKSIIVELNAAQQFTAVGHDIVGNIVPASPKWSVNGGGAISAGGLFTAGAEEGEFIVTADDAGISDTATVIIAEDIFSQGLIAHWAFDEGGGATAGDSSGNGREGTVNGASWTTGILGGALSFDGVNDYVKIGSNVGLTAFPYTFSAWINYQGQGSGKHGWILSLGDITTDNVYFATAIESTDKYMIVARNTKHQTGLGTSVAPGWHHVTGVFESDTSKKLYVDGVLVGNLTVPVAFNSAVNTVYVGARVVKVAPDLYFNGLIDDVRVYNRALNETEIQTLSNPPVSNQPPTLSISATPTSGTAPLAVTFTATASDADGTITSYAWDFGDSTSSTEQNPTHTYDKAGAYTAKVTVSDNGGAKATAEIGITVNSNQPPTLTVSATPTTGTAPLTVTFTATAQDPDGTIASYAWDFGDSSTSNERNPTHTYQATGAYTAKVTVTDNAGATATAEITITVTLNQPPTVAVTAEPTGGGAPLTVNFTATAQDPDGTIAGYAWDFGDNSTSTEQNPTHTYNAAGTYTAKVTVTDNAGSIATAEIVIKVLGPPGKPVHKDAG